MDRTAGRAPFRNRVSGRTKGPLFLRPIGVYPDRSFCFLGCLVAHTRSRTPQRPKADAIGVRSLRLHPPYTPRNHRCGLGDGTSCAAGDHNKPEGLEVHESTGGWGAALRARRGQDEGWGAALWARRQDEGKGGRVAGNVEGAELVECACMRWVWPNERRFGWGSRRIGESDLQGRGASPPMGRGRAAAGWAQARRPPMGGPPEVALRIPGAVDFRLGIGYLQWMVTLANLNRSVLDGTRVLAGASEFSVGSCAGGFR